MNRINLASTHDFVWKHKLLQLLRNKLKLGGRRGEGAWRKSEDYKFSSYTAGIYLLPTAPSYQTLLSQMRVTIIPCFTRRKKHSPQLSRQAENTASTDPPSTQDFRGIKPYSLLG